MTRFVFDTNVIVSALLFNDSVPGQAFIRALNHGMILVSGALVGEFEPCTRPGQVRPVCHPRRARRVSCITDTGIEPDRNHRGCPSMPRSQRRPSLGVGRQRQCDIHPHRRCRLARSKPISWRRDCNACRVPEIDRLTLETVRWNSHILCPSIGPALLPFEGR